MTAAQPLAPRTQQRQTAHLSITRLATVHADQYAPAATGYEILYLHEGHLTLSLNRASQQLFPGQVCFIVPGQLRRVQPGVNAAGYCLEVSSELFSSISPQAIFAALLQHVSVTGSPFVLQPDSSCLDDIEDAFHKILRGLARNNPVQLPILQSYARTLLLYLSNALPVDAVPDTSSTELRLVKTFLQLVSSYYSYRKQVRDYASELCVTRSYLNRVVKRVSGFTASQLIQRFVIHEAQRQAVHAGASMKQIAYSLGFDDSAHFSKYFKANSGTNFSNYKKELASLQLNHC